MDRQTEERVHRQTDRHTNTFIEGQREREKNVQINRLIEMDVNYLKFYLFVKFD